MIVLLTHWSNMYGTIKKVKINPPWTVHFCAFTFAMVFYISLFFYICMNFYIQMYGIKFYHICFFQYDALQLQIQVLLHDFQLAFQLNPNFQMYFLLQTQILHNFRRTLQIHLILHFHLHLILYLYFYFQILLIKY